jgi:hypothetical protein
MDKLEQRAPFLHIYPYSPSESVSLLDFVVVKRVANINHKGLKTIAQRTQSNEYQKYTFVPIAKNFVNLRG